MYKDENHYTLCRRGKLWGYYWYDSNNKRHYRSTGKKTKHEAQKVINKRIAEGDLQWKEEKKDVLFKDYAANFFILGPVSYPEGKGKDWERSLTNHNIQLQETPGV